MFDSSNTFLLYLSKYGVPPVSSLDPLLFDVFINDTDNSVCNAKYLLFADDFKTYRSINNLDDSKTSAARH